MNRITNEQREAIVREAIAKRDAILHPPPPDPNRRQSMQAKPTQVDSMNRLRVEAENDRHQLRGALLWLLWHHQGGSSITGVACRRALGIGQFDRLTESQIAQAKEWDAGLLVNVSP